MIQLGDSGDHVRAWQRIVGALPDGKFEQATDRKVRVWQEVRGVEPDGVVGPLTRAALEPDDLIKPYEAFRSFPYDDHDGARLTYASSVWRRPDGAAVIGYPTIGWGRRLFPGQVVLACTIGEADAWFDAELAQEFLPAVLRVGQLDAGQVAAAASFAYNCGTGALAKLAAADFSDAVWLGYAHSRGVLVAGLVERRKEELALFRG